jgi:hypothetical protein
MKVSSTTKNGKRIWQRVIETCLTDNKEPPLGLGHDSKRLYINSLWNAHYVTRENIDVLIGKYIFCEGNPIIIISLTRQVPKRW